MSNQEKLEVANMIAAALKGAPTTTTTTKANGKGKAAPAAKPNNRDSLLLEVVRKYKSAPRSDGKPSGTFQVKVYSHLKAAGISQESITAAIDDACKRGILSRMYIKTKGGNGMMLLFDAAERPQPSYERTTLSAEETAAARAAWGL